MPDQRKLIYLATPYSDDNPKVVDARFSMAVYAAGAIFKAGYYVYSTISHTHPIARACSLPTGFEFWEGYDTRMISCCDELWVLCIPGWETSVGVQEEIKIAHRLGIPVRGIYQAPGNNAQYIFPEFVTQL